jgi:hypothetical protein
MDLVVGMSLQSKGCVKMDTLQLWWLKVLAKS